MKNYTCCINQFVRPVSDFYIPMEGVGDCSICIAHEDNKFCKRYYPITIGMFEVEEE